MPTASRDSGKAARTVIGSVLRLPNQLFILIIRLYRHVLSPYMAPSCRFYPSCSQYGMEAFGKYNFIKAFGLTVWRILRCNPFNPGGYDPLP